MADDEPFVFKPDADGNLDLEAVIFQAIGAGSVCWERKDLEEAGVFDSEQAAKIGNATIDWLNEHFLKEHVTDEELSVELARRRHPADRES